MSMNITLAIEVQDFPVSRECLFSLLQLYPPKNLVNLENAVADTYHIGD